MTLLSSETPAILFVNPSLGTPAYRNEDRLRSYLTLGTLASALRNRSFLKRFALELDRHGSVFNCVTSFPQFDVRILNLSEKPDRQSLFDCFADFAAGFGETPLMVGMTATSAQLDEAAEIAWASSEVIPASIRVIGGAHVSVAAADFLNQSLFQVACVGEGVETLTEIALRLANSREVDFGSVAGIVFKDACGHIHKNPLREPLLHLDDYPFPTDSLDLFGDLTADYGNNRHHIVYILSGYGCPHDCIFCAQRAIHGKKIRERSAGNIFEEIGGLVNRGFHKFAFVQETFLNRDRRVAEFCRLITAAGLEVEWTAEARADQLSREQLEYMQSAGLRFIQIGVESGDPALLKQLGKRIDLGRVVRLLDWCRELEINTAVYLLVGLPGQGWQSILQSALFIKDHPPYNRITRHASVAIAIPYPGTNMALTQSVRLSGDRGNQLSWPNRNPNIHVNDAGEFLGENFTETNDMTSHEILEAWLYLDDFCHFLLHALYPEKKERQTYQLAKSMEYADRLLYMIQRRTIRDLIVRARPDQTPAKRRKAHREILFLDKEVETHFKDVTRSTEPVNDIFVRFLSTIEFKNGFDAMKILSIGNRLKWMKLCALVWHLAGRNFNTFEFSQDKEETGVSIDGLLQDLADSRLRECLEQIVNRNAMQLIPEIAVSGRTIEAFGFAFRKANNRILMIDSVDIQC